MTVNLRVACPSDQDENLSRIDKMTAAKHETYVECVGDSLTEGWVNVSTMRPYTLTLSNLLNSQSAPAQQFIVENHGVSGERLAEIRIRLLQIMHWGAQLNLPIVWIVLGGANDMAYASDDSMHEDLKVIVNDLRNYVRLHGGRCYFMTLLQKGNEKLNQSQRAKRELFNQRIIEQCNAAGFQVIHLDNYIPYPSFGGSPANWANDGVHLSEAGYKLMGTTIFNAIKGDLL
ncbi:hypothetical protein Pelo_8087 [Pelomyxa schiedti]|nr:hypothetical protein Pelo_8087 [Pelomyxa schiedti]